MTEPTRITSNNATDNRAMQVFLWDIGPEKPVAPKRPKVPVGKEGDPEYDLAMIEFGELKADYETALKAYRQAKLDYADFEKRYGGPYEIMMWSCDAQDALWNGNRKNSDGMVVFERYRISSRTHGYGNLPNGGLPAGLKPGHGQAENVRRMQEGEADLADARRRDPQFGYQEART